MPTSPQDSEREALAKWLEENRREIVAEWVKSIQDDPEIPDADHLTLAALQDHFPEMVDELFRGLRDPTTLLDADTRQAGIDHGKRRWRHQYRLDELLRELARIREILLLRIRAFCEEHQFTQLREEADTKVRRFFDVIVAQSAQQFMKEQAAEITLRSKQLSEAFDQVRVATDQLRSIAQSRFRMLRGVSHELRNAFQEMSFGATNLLQEENADERKAIAEAVSLNAVHLQRLLDRLQQFSSILAGDCSLRIEDLDLRAFFDEIEKTHRVRAERKGLNLTLDRQTGPLRVKTDHEKLRHIADILLSNAIEYTKRGAIEVAATNAESDRWKFRVVDSGMGIQESDSKLVFHEFHRRDRTANRGVGLGLVIARYLAHLMHGEITFESRDGEGSRFEVELPRDMSASVA